MYRALYRKWRPRDFDDVCGQEQITDILKYEVAEKKTSHAYLFCGSRGTGKTSCAKILAKAVNCEAPRNGNPCNACPACRAIDAGTATDVIEMDAASNTGVDNVRDIKDEIVFTPAELRYRVYIIDEVHMMSGSAFNALLKTLEEPPEHVLFILATTELQKLPSTIISRCQRFDFRRLSSPVIVSRLMKIAKEEGIELEPEGARIVARMALGGMRDAISLLELCAGTNRRVDAACVTEILGAGNRSMIERLVRAVTERDYPTIYALVADEVMSSRDLLSFFRDILEYYRDLLVTCTTPQAEQYLDLSDVEMQSLRELSSRFTLGTLLYHTRLLEGAFADMQRADTPRRAIIELTLTRMCEPKLSDTTESLLARLDALESEVAQLKYGGGAAPRASAPVASPAPVDTRQAPPEEKKRTQAAAVTEKKAPAPSPAPGKPVLRPIPAWSEIVERVAKARPGMHGFLEAAKAYRSEDGHTYLIRVSSPFSARMLSRPDSLAALQLAIAEEEGRDLSGAEIRVTGEEEQGQYRLIDELQEAIQS